MSKLSNFFVTSILVLSTIPNLYAQRIPGPGRDPRVPIDLMRELRSCQMRNNRLESENVLLNDQLTTCRVNSGNQTRISQLEREVNELEMRNQDLRNQVYRLEEIIRERDIRDGRTGDFDLAQSIRACQLIKNATYAQSCVAASRKHKILAEVIESCAKIQNVYYANECVLKSGENKSTVSQVNACRAIKNDDYTVQCVAFAGNKNLPSSVIEACTSGDQNSYYQLECVKSL